MVYVNRQKVFAAPVPRYKYTPFACVFLYGSNVLSEVLYRLCYAEYKISRGFGYKEIKPDEAIDFKTNA